MLIKRRGFIASLGASFVAAPAIVRAASMDMVRGVVMPIEKWIWRKRQRIISDPYIGYRGTEDYAYRQLLTEADTSAFTEITPHDNQVIQTLTEMVHNHHTPALTALEYDIPLGFKRLRADYSGYVDD